MMSNIEGIGARTWNTINRIVRPHVRNYALDGQKEYAVKMIGTGKSFPKAIKQMPNHGGVAKDLGNGNYDLYILTHSLPKGVPGIKIDDIDVYGNKQDQYLLGPFRAAKSDSNIIAVTDSQIASPHFIKSTSKLTYKEALMLRKIENYFTAKNREDIRLAYFAPDKLTIDVSKNLGETVITY